MACNEMQASARTSTETVRLIKDGEGGGGKGMEGGEEGEYIPIATLSPPEWLLH